MLLVNLYERLRHYEFESTYDDFFKELREIIGTCYESYYDFHGYLTGRQTCTSELAIKFIMRDMFNDAVRETLDFMHNYRNNNHNITYEEYTVLNCILTCYESRCSLE